MDDTLTPGSGWPSTQAHIEHAAAFAGVLPPCALSQAFECDGCSAEGIDPCPIGTDPDYLSYLLHLRDLFLRQSTKRASQIKVLQQIFRRHKLPLHWQFAALLAIREDASLFQSPDSVRGILYFNPQVFTMIRDGVFVLR